GARRRLGTRLARDAAVIAWYVLLTSQRGLALWLVQPSARKTGRFFLVLLFSVVDRVLRDVDRHVLVGHDRLAAQARLRFQAPGAVEQVFFGLVHLAERFEALAHDHVAGGAGAAHLARVLDVHTIVEQRLADRGAALGLDGHALGAIFGVRQDGDLRHGMSVQT